MRDQSETSGTGGNKGARRLPLFGIVVIAGFIALAAFIFLGKSKPAVPPTTTGTPASTNDAIASSPAAGGGRQEVGKSSGTQDARLDQLIRALNDVSVPLDERKKAILALAQDGSPAALAALKAALGHSAPEIRQAIAASLGQCHSREAVAMLKALLSDPDEAVARSAVRSLAGGDQPGAAPAVVDLLNDPNASVDLRCEAALALGDLKEPWVLDPLSRAAKESEDEDVIKAALDGIAKLDFSASRPFFEDYLRSPDVASDLRIEAIDALAQVSGDPTSFLAQLAANDADPDIRAAAARAMSATEATGNAGPELLSLLRNESDPDVRLRLYQALLNQQSFDTATALALVQNEQDPATLVAGLDALAKALRDNPNPQLQNYFNQTAVPELKQIALTGQSLDDRQEAVIALTRAHTPEAMAALAEVAQQMAQQQKAAQNTAQAQANPANAAPTSPQKPQSQSP